MNKKGVDERSEKSNFQKWICIIGYAMVPVFFTVMYFLMTETYEDIMQGNSESTKTVPEIIDSIYHYIPRLGEFYQHIAVHFMTAQVSFGLDMIFRFITAMIASGTIYFSTVFVLGRRPRLEYKDVAVYLGILLFIMISIFSAAFTYRFSDANNYVLGLLVAVLFLNLFRIKILENKWYKLIGVVLLGFLFGITTEITPVAFLILIFCFCVVKVFRKEMAISDLWKKYRVQSFAVLGLVIGLAFFYFGGGLGGRTGGGYAEVYEYISPMSFLKDPLYVGYKLLHHVWYNVRYIFFAIPLMSIYIFVEATIFKKERKNLFWQIFLMLFCVLFVGATSLIAVHDDLYPRFMVPVFLAITLATMLFINHVLNFVRVSGRTLKRLAITTVIFGGILIIDMSFAFTLYNLTMAPKLEAIHYNPGGELQIDQVSGTTMIPSPIFSLKQLPPFDWGPAADYTKFGL